MKIYIFAISIILTACSHFQGSNPKATNVFIHGSHFDAEVWAPVIELFSSSNNLAINLKGRADNESAGLTEMAKEVCSKIPETSNLIVHSFGGAVANQMIGVCPKKIVRIVYVTALVPLKGEQAFDLMTNLDQAEYGKAVSFTKTRIKPKDTKTFLNVMDAEITTKNMPLFKIYSESYKAGEDTISYDVAKFDAIPKCYIYTSKDKIITPATQEKYTKRITLAKTATLATGHLPMLSDNFGLASAIRSCL